MIGRLGELMEREGGIDAPKSIWKWFGRQESQTVFSIRLTDAVEMHRDYVSRILGECEQVGEEERGGPLCMTRQEVAQIGEDWAIRRDGAKGISQFPLFTNDEWGMIREMACPKWANWGNYRRGETDPRRNEDRSTYGKCRRIGRHFAESKWGDSDGA